ncbi:MAG TPA: protein translocase subunit SecD [Acidimicrobiia bacterium]|nr:protein translocase subunit SecD [Acidimicrobiia bacterium]
MLPISKWRLFFTVVALAAAGYTVASIPVQLGLDLRGGTQIILEAEDTADVLVDDDVMSRTLEVLRRRVDAFGVAEPTLQVTGERRIIIELPGLADPDEAVELIGRTAQLTFHPVLASYPVGSVPGDADGLVLPGGPGEELVLGPVAVSGAEVVNALELFDTQAGQWIVTIDFRSDGGAAWEEMTAEAACAPLDDPTRRVAIVLDEAVISSPGVSFQVQCGVGITGGGTVISGGFDEAEARELALLIRAGALPVPVEVIERGTIGPTLGEAAVAASVQATIIGAALTILYMLVFYRVMGVVVAVSLGVYGIVAYSVLALMGATLTLPGIAGFVLAIGMAVDANVLVYERAKEENAEGSSIADSLTAGFARAWSAIADANMTTLLAAVLLFFFASGAVRGFGITLTVGVLVSMFSALVVTRLILEVLTRFAWFRERPALVGMTVGRRFQQWLRTSGPDLLGSWKRWLIVSVVAVAVSLSGLLVNGVNFGLEFLGGRLVEYETSTSVDLDELRTALADGGIPRAVIQESGQGTIVIRTEQLDAEEEQGFEQVVQSVAGETTLIRDQFVGPTLGTELRNRALLALGIALLLQLGYLAIRFRWTIGLASVIAMFHDVAILIGVFAWLGKTFDGVFLASLLTVIGYSLNDSVVIFDRIREQRGLRPDEPLARIANDACLQTLPRTINTGMGATLILATLYFVGGDTLSDFALALIIGIAVGTYSSIFTASPIAIALETRFPPPPPKEKEDELQPGVPRGRSSRN